MKHAIDPEGRRLPIKLDSTSNGEFAPVPLLPANLAANRLAQEWASSFSKKTNLTRRRFLVSSCGAASTLLAFNAANAAAGRYQEIHRARPHCPRAQRLPGESRAALQHLRAEDPAGVSPVPAAYFAAASCFSVKV
jgi:hypothetical protein